MGLPWSAVMYIHVQLTATVEIENLSLTLKIIVRAKSRLVHHVHEWEGETWVGCCEMLSRPAPPRRRTRTERDPFSGRHRVLLGSDGSYPERPACPYELVGHRNKPQVQEVSHQTPQNPSLSRHDRCKQARFSASTFPPGHESSDFMVQSASCLYLREQPSMHTEMQPSQSHENRPEYCAAVKSATQSRVVYPASTSFFLSLEIVLVSASNEQTSAIISCAC